MPGGKAHGQNHSYQILCQSIIQQLRHQECLAPYAGDGVDVPIECGGTIVTFDVALKDARDRVVVVECKRWSDPVPQGTLFEFWGKVEHLRRALATEVAGIFVTKTGFQSGAENSALDPRGLGIEIAICDDQPPPNYDIVFRRFDLEREAVVRRLLAQRQIGWEQFHTAVFEAKVTKLIDKKEVSSHS